MLLFILFFSAFMAVAKPSWDSVPLRISALILIVLTFASVIFGAIKDDI